jgi:uncharacterized membrane protein
MRDVLLIAAPFLACIVEMVEALTIVLAVGLTRGWRVSLTGAAAAVLLLGVVVGALGSRLASLPIAPLRLFIGAFVLAFGLRWLQKAIRRAAGLKALHDENAIFAAETSAAQSVEHRDEGIDWWALAASFKGVLIEGVEVVFIVISVGSAQRNVGLASVGAAAAFGVVALAGIAIHKPLARVPENSLKFAVGILLTSFGMVWILEGAGAVSSGNDWFLVGALALVSVISAGLVTLVRRRGTRPHRLSTVGQGD